MEMDRISFEIKARCVNPATIRKILRSRKASFKGLDRQIDTYFYVPSGRLKLREGKIEKALIYYKRINQRNSKRCDAFLWKCSDLNAIKKILELAWGILVVVDKQREIYFLGNVKFHIDRVKRLGNFVEIEAQGRAGKTSPAKLKDQCEFYQNLFGIRPRDLLADSYSDQILRF